MSLKHDVFVSFRGEDTQNSFADHLFGALYSKGFVTFKDDIKLRKGENISTELLQAIEGSQILIVVFSRNYASSTWCLQELAKIADCIGGSGQTVLPIFYDVSPSEVRKQSGNYGNAFVKHEERFKDHFEMVQTWRKALAQLANLSGWDIKDKPQYEEIGKIIKEVACKLDHKLSTPPDGIVGIQSRVEELEKLVVLHSNADVRVLGICGMGGIGKSTLATNLHCRISNQFDATCFIDDYGPKEAQEQILRQLLNEESLQLDNRAARTNLVQIRLRHKKVLIVLDNVDEVKQLEKLTIKREWLGAGSRIIIISRDEHILREYGVDKVYKVQLLNSEDALQLFCRKAFKCDDVMRGYRQLTNESLQYANGLPLAIEVLGSFLSDLDVSEWRSALVRLRKNPEKDIMDVLRTSFDALKDTEKEIFLDISCFFHGKQKQYVERFLDVRGFYPQIGIKVLVDKSLVTIDEYGDITMPDLLKELGRSIVREKSPKEPRKWSRLWDCNDLHNVMQENTAAESVEAIVIERYEDEFQKTMRADAFSKMTRLQLLQLGYGNLNFSGSLSSLSSELGLLDWPNYPFQYLPTSFEPAKLVELVLRGSNVKQLWEDSKPLDSLRKMDLSHSINLTKMPDFGDVPNLKSLWLEGCIKLVQIDPSICILTKLDYLNLRNCKSLISIPNNIFGISSLRFLLLCGCSKLYNNQLLGEQQSAAASSSSILQTLKSTFNWFYSGRHEGSSIGFSFPSSLNIPCLQELDLSFCNLLEVPDAIGWLHSLKWLNLGGNNFVTLPSSIKELSKLLKLRLEHCKQLKHLPELPVRSKASRDRFRAGLYIFNCPNLIEIERCSSMAFSWMMQLFEVRMQEALHHSEIHIVIPGAEIPRWFNKQSEGSSMSMDDLIHYMHDENCIGVACSAELVIHVEPTCINSSHHEEGSFSFTFEMKNGDFMYHMPMLIEKDLFTVESNHHLVLLFFSRKEFIKRTSLFTPKGTTHDMDIDSMKLIFSINKPQGLCMEVKNCGYHWMLNSTPKCRRTAEILRLGSW